MSNFYYDILKVDRENKPFAVQINDEIIGYSATHKDALRLVEIYKQTNYFTVSNDITLEELFDVWLKAKKYILKASYISAFKAAFNYIKHLKDMKYTAIKAIHMQSCIDNCDKGPSMKSSVKNLWHQLDKFGLELDLVSKQYSLLLSSPPVCAPEKIVFSEEEIKKLWENVDIKAVDLVLFLIYTGFRRSELLELKLDNVDLENKTIKGGIKTAAGKNRIVPIHSKIINIVEKRYKASKIGFLFENNGKQLSKSQLRIMFQVIMSDLDMKHTVHECRHTLRSRLDSAGANKVCIDKILGHKSGGTGERVYTHKTIEELRSNIELID